jgi:hypothetical protein
MEGDHRCVITRWPVARWVPWLGAALVFVGVVFQWSVASGEPQSLPEALAFAGWALLPLPFVVVGALIVTRQPRNVIGWLLFLPPFTLAIDLLAGIALGAADASEEADFLVLVVSWAASLAWMGLIFPLFHLLLVFPTGRVLSSRWRWLVRLELAMIGFLVVTSAFAQELGEEPRTVPNPVGFLPASFFGPVFNVVWTAGLVTLAIAGAVAMVVRYRQARNAERQQLKWFLFAVAVFATTFSAVALGPASGESLDPLIDLAFALSIWVVPVSIGIAVLRYRLFDIDRLVSRTVTYVAVAGSLALTYAGLVVGIRALAPVEGDLPVALSTLVVAFAFLPLVRRVQRAVDRRFFRSRYDAAVVVARVADELRGSLDLQAVTNRAEVVVTEVFAPELVTVWLADGR